MNYRASKYPNICNHCILKEFKAQAAAIGNKIVIRPGDEGGVDLFSVPQGSYEGLLEQDKVGHLTSVQDHCTC